MPRRPSTSPKVPKPQGITCAHYQQVPGSKRCRSYQDGGRCQRPGAAGGRCQEWLKVNTPAGTPPEPASRDLFGAHIQPPLAGRPAHTAPLAPGEAPAPQPPLVRSVTDEQIASFKALGVEVCIRSEVIGPIYLVPEYTGAPRAELSIEHSVVLTAICSAFPGAKVVEIRRGGR